MKRFTMLFVLLGGVTLSSLSAARQVGGEFVVLAKLVQKERILLREREGTTRGADEYVFEIEARPAGYPPIGLLKGSKIKRNVIRVFDPSYVTDPRSDYKDDLSETHHDSPGGQGCIADNDKTYLLFLKQDVSNRKEEKFILLSCVSMKNTEYSGFVKD